MLEKITVSKGTITRLFGVAVVLVVAGAVVGTAAVIAALANGAITFGGPQLVTLNAGPLAGALVALVAAGLLGGIGSLAAVVAWAAALVNTYHLEDKTWFFAILASGLVSLGWVALIAYAFRGPDGASRATRIAAAASAQG